MGFHFWKLESGSLIKLSVLSVSVSKRYIGNTLNMITPGQYLSNTHNQYNFLNASIHIIFQLVESYIRRREKEKNIA